MTSKAVAVVDSLESLTGMQHGGSLQRWRDWYADQGHTDVASIRAWAHAERGDTDRAFALLEQAVAARDGQVMFLGVQPAWDGLRDDPRFSAVLQRVGLDGS